MPPEGLPNSSPSLVHMWYRIGLGLNHYFEFVLHLLYLISIFICSLFPYFSFFLIFIYLLFRNGGLRRVCSQTCFIPSGGIWNGYYKRLRSYSASSSLELSHWLVLTAKPLSYNYTHYGAQCPRPRGRLSLGVVKGVLSRRDLHHALTLQCPCLFRCSCRLCCSTRRVGH